MRSRPLPYIEVATLILTAVLIPVTVISLRSTEEIHCSKDDVEEFMTAFTPHKEDLYRFYAYDAEHCWQVTPPDVADQTDIRIFKFSDSCESFAMMNGEVYRLCECFGGYGFLNAVPWDYDGDGIMDLLIASSWGSGIHRSEISVFNGVDKTVQVIYNTFGEQDPHIDLNIRLAKRIGQGSEVVIEKVIVYAEAYDYAHLQYKSLNIFHPSVPFVVQVSS